MTAKILLIIVCVYFIWFIYSSNKYDIEKQIRKNKGDRFKKGRGK